MSCAVAVCMNSTHVAAKSGSTTYLCEYAHDPFDDCYCRHITGKSVPNIALYCMEHFRECPVYRNRRPESCERPGTLQSPKEQAQPWKKKSV